MAFNPTQKLEIKRGNSFSLLLAYTDEAGLPLSLEGMQVSAQLRNINGELLGELKVTILDEVKGLAQLTLPADFIPPRQHIYSDIRLIQGDAVQNSDVVQLIFKDVVTYG